MPYSWTEDISPGASIDAADVNEMKQALDDFYADKGLTYPGCSSGPGWVTLPVSSGDPIRPDELQELRDRTDYAWQETCCSGYCEGDDSEVDGTDLVSGCSGYYSSHCDTLYSTHYPSDDDSHWTSNDGTENGSYDGSLDNSYDSTDHKTYHKTYNGTYYDTEDVGYDSTADSTIYGTNYSSYDSDLETGYDSGYDSSYCSSYNSLYDSPLGGA